MRRSLTYRGRIKDTASLQSATRRFLRRSLSFLSESKNKLDSVWIKGKKWIKKLTLKRK